jgi:hypothetical protein
MRRAGLATLPVLLSAAPPKRRHADGQLGNGSGLVSGLPEFSDAGSGRRAASVIIIVLP